MGRNSVWLVCRRVAEEHTLRHVVNVPCVVIKEMAGGWGEKIVLQEVKRESQVRMRCVKEIG